MKHTPLSICETIERAYSHQRHLLEGAKRAAAECTHPDDLVTRAAAYKAAASRVNTLECLIHNIASTSDNPKELFTVETLNRVGA